MKDEDTAPAYTLVFDFDGVVLDSATLKRKAFADVYCQAPEDQYRAIVAYLSRRSGQPREVKFRHIEEHILGKRASDARIQTLCAQFKASIEERLLTAPPIVGALAFLRDWHQRRSLYLLSATPEHELKTIVEKRHLAPFFKEVVGAPPDKVTGLRNLLTRHQLVPNATVMIGDSYNDYRAARSNGTLFVGVTANPNKSPFPEDVVTTEDLSTLAQALKRL